MLGGVIYILIKCSFSAKYENPRLLLINGGGGGGKKLIILAIRGSGGYKHQK